MSDIARHSGAMSSRSERRGPPVSAPPAIPLQSAPRVIDVLPSSVLRHKPSQYSSAGNLTAAARKAMPPPTAPSFFPLSPPVPYAAHSMDSGNESSEEDDGTASLFNALSSIAPPAAVLDGSSLAGHPAWLEQRYTELSPGFALPFPRRPYTSSAASPRDTADGSKAAISDAKEHPSMFSSQTRHGGASSMGVSASQSAAMQPWADQSHLLNHQHLQTDGGGLENSSVPFLRSCSDGAAVIQERAVAVPDSRWGVASPVFERSVERHGMMDDVMEAALLLAAEEFIAIF